MKDKTKVQLTKEEIETLELHSYRLKDRCIIQLGAWVGLRSAEIVDASVQDLWEEVIENDSAYWLEVYGKMTNQKKGEGKKKRREAFVPRKVYHNLRMLINENRLKETDPLIPNRNGKHMTTSGLRDIVYRIAERAYDATDKDKFLDVSPHDLRRFFATYNLNELRKSPRVMMAIGGWNSFQAIKPYWGKPSKENIVREMREP